MRLPFTTCAAGQRLKALVRSDAPETTSLWKLVSRVFPASGTWPPLLLLVTVLVMAAGERDYAGQRSAATFPEVPLAGNITTMPGVSGLAWVGADTFITVHDAKYPAETSSSRIGIIRRTAQNDQPTWSSLTVRWPRAEGPSSDLESIARIPGTRQFLLVESGAGRKPVPHIYLLEWHRNSLSILEAAPWPTPPHNVEGSTVARVGNDLVFVYAERSEGEAEGTIGWSLLSADALRQGHLRWGPITHEMLQRPAWVSPDARLASATEIGPDGRLYVASSHDPGRDAGPFRSVVWEAGRFVEDQGGNPGLQLTPNPCRIATLDGLKTEGLAIRKDTRAGGPGPHPAFFIGTDDEQYGAVFRPLPSASC